jgi:hypothetical protein
MEPVVISDLAFFFAKTKLGCRCSGNVRAIIDIDEIRITTERNASVLEIFL